MIGIVAINQLLRSDALLFRSDGNGHAVFICAADVQHIAFLHALVTNIDVRGQIGAGQMAQMDGAIGIGQCAGDKDAFHVSFL
ncbi:MAG: hypothetical protein BWY83_00832 [bacterium ADurb.Bin478]|nr:MAG: hypothetical protein BWY83_00832 [bacterium ADurb.Bin478]